LLSSVLAVALAPATAHAQQSKITLATATEGGAFVVYGLALVDGLRSVDATFEIRSRPTKGCGENIGLLEAGEATSRWSRARPRRRCSPASIVRSANSRSSA
jgi:TRAP-type uncharacterized transport system substrate-binding protein